MDFAYFHKHCRAADERGEMWKVECVLATRVYIRVNEGRIYPGHAVLQVFAGTFEHESGKNNEHK